MLTTNKESKSGIIYKGIDWSNTCSNSEQWLISIYEVEFKVVEKKKHSPKITVLVKNGVRV